MLLNRLAGALRSNSRPMLPNCASSTLPCLWLLFFSLRGVSRSSSLTGCLSILSLVAYCPELHLSCLPLPWRILSLSHEFCLSNLVVFVRAIVLVRLIHHVVETKSLMEGFSAAGNVVCKFCYLHLAYSFSNFTLVPGGSALQCILTNSFVSTSSFSTCGIGLVDENFTY